MRNNILTSIAFFAAGLAGCGSSSNNTTDMAKPADMAMTTPADMTVVSCCGKPGMVAVNDLGVGLYCPSATSTACNGNGSATLCSAIGNTATTQTFFCTFVIPNSDAGALCGANAQAQCTSEGCACVPTSCVTNAPPGCP